MTAVALDSELETIARQMQRRFNDNLEAFSQYQPELYQQLAGAPDDEAQIDLSPEGMRLLYKQREIYPGDPWQTSQKQIDDFLVNPGAFAIYPDPPTRDENLQHTYLRKVIPSRGGEPAQITAYQFDGVNMPMLMCFGIASGFYIEQIVSRFTLRHLILFEAQISLLRTSLYCIDWRELFEIFSVSGKRLDIIVGSDAARSTDIALHSVRRYSQIYSTLFLFFDHIAGEFYEDLKSRLKQTLPVSIRGIGYYDDEKQGLLHTLENIAQHPPIFSRPIANPEGMVAVVVGAGPSLDQNIDSIRRHREKIVLFSCGTALGPLLANGIRPDFHLEQERHKSIGRVISEIPQQEQLGDIHLLALNVIPPDAACRFKSFSIVLKGDDTAAHLFPSDIPRLTHCNPTVANFGVALTASLGFEQIILFGVDFGMKTARAHHASGTIYEGENYDLSYEVIAPTLKNQIEGNFGGMIKANNLYVWGKNAVEQVVELHPRCNFTNCSDGVRFNNIDPQQHTDIEFGEYPVGGENAVRNVQNCFETKPYSPVEIKKNVGVLHGEYSRLCTSLVHRLNATVDNRARLVEYLDSLYAIVDNRDNLLAVQIVLGAVVKHFVLCIYAHANSIPVESEAMAFANRSFPIFAKFLEITESDLAGLT